MEMNTISLIRVQQPIDRSWSEYPIGTKANACNGGYWEKTQLGWKWCTGSTYPKPGGDAVSVTFPDNHNHGLWTTTDPMTRV